MRVRTAAEVNAEIAGLRALAVERMLGDDRDLWWVSAIVDPGYGGLEVIERLLADLRARLPRGEAQLRVDVDPAGLPGLMLTMAVVAR